MVWNVTCWVPKHTILILLLILPKANSIKPLSTALFWFDRDYTFKSEPPYHISSHTHTPRLLCTGLSQQANWLLLGYLRANWLSGNCPCNSSQDQPATSPSSHSNTRHGSIGSPANCFTPQIYWVNLRGSAGPATLSSPHHFGALSFGSLEDDSGLFPVPQCLFNPRNMPSVSRLLGTEERQVKREARTLLFPGKIPYFLYFGRAVPTMLFILRLEKQHISYPLPPHQGQ